MSVPYEIEEGCSIYEIVLHGFYGGDDKTDHLIKWVEAPSKEAIEKFIKNHRNPMLKADAINPITDTTHFLVGGDLDVKLDAEGNVLKGIIGRVDVPLDIEIEPPSVEVIPATDREMATYLPGPEENEGAFQVADKIIHALDKAYSREQVVAIARHIYYLSLQN